MDRKHLSIVIAGLALVGVVATFASAYNPNGKYKGKMNWTWKLGTFEANGTAAGPLKLDGTALTGKTTASDGCIDNFILQAKNAFATSGSSARVITGTINDKCGSNTTVYTVLPNAKATVKLNANNRVKIALNLKAKGTSGADKGAVFTVQLNALRTGNLPN